MQRKKQVSAVWSNIENNMQSQTILLTLRLFDGDDS